ncbi:tetratricopeptide repeat protein [Capsulimonas corticalis]|uniref:Tetratricopeptide repeat protein n=1 Tax=Capsulimonas corticalis TaxID=2219043 RepID=A0A402D0K5_9BACT|nr:FxSxx-COOH system tetratricopeptide repeat protein [Capsulimonas corticalis]BDI33625.1 tetratricopeptide repeat protein [Capsulimonas corticalis]
MSDSPDYGPTHISGGQGIQSGTGNTQNNYFTLNLNQAQAAGVDLAPLIARLASPALSEPGRLWNVPYPPNPFFTGREEILANLERTLASTQKVALTQAYVAKNQAISGLGGVGKTQTAIEYAYRHREQYHAILWAQADTETALNSSFRGIAVLLDLPEKDAEEISHVREAVKRWLTEKPDYLLILDNADTPDLLAAYLPLHLAGHLLLTSRARHFGTINLPHPTILLVLSEKEAVAFLLQRTDRLDADEAEQKAALELAQEMGCLPLALEQAGAYLCEKQSTFQSYLASYRKRRIRLFQDTKAETGAYEKTVATTWSLNFEAVEQESEAATELLRVSAFFNPNGIPEELVLLGASEIGQAVEAALTDYDEDPLLMDELLDHLARYSLIQRDTKERTYDVHRLVQAVIQHGMDEQTRCIYAKKSVLAVAAAFPKPDYSVWGICERLLPHAIICSDHILIYQFSFLSAAQFLNSTAYYLHDRAKYSIVEQLYLCAINIYKNSKYVDQFGVAASVNNLAAFYEDEGFYEKAEPLYEEVLCIYKKIYWRNNPSVAIAMNNLGGLFAKQGKYERAEPLYLQALDVYKQQPLRNISKIATCMTNLAFSYIKLHKYIEAEMMALEALSIQEKSIELNYPEIAHSVNTLATVYFSQGDYSKAEVMYLKAFNIRKERIGINHPETANSANCLSVLYYYQARYEDAELLCEQGLLIRRRVFANDHPDIASSLITLANIYEGQGRYEDANQHYIHGLSIYEKTLGAKHPITMDTNTNYQRFRQIRQM